MSEVGSWIDCEYMETSRYDLVRQTKRLSAKVWFFLPDTVYLSIFKDVEVHELWQEEPNFGREALYSITELTIGSF